MNATEMKFDSKKYKVYTWKNLLVLHWIINPGLAFNELILGQRVPKISLEDRASNKPRSERSITPCPHCNALHDSRTWSSENGTAFKNWFGLYCPTCGGIIPCVLNLTTIFVLIVSAPIWYWFYKPIRKYWLSKQPVRFTKVDAQKISNPFEAKGWIGQGLNFGLIMFALNDLIIPIFSGKEMQLTKLLIGIPIWILGGMLFAYIMKLFLSKKGEEK
jgi:hypothetical protein